MSHINSLINIPMLPKSGPGCSGSAPGLLRGAYNPSLDPPTSLTPTGTRQRYLSPLVVWGSDQHLTAPSLPDSLPSSNG